MILQAVLILVLYFPLRKSVKIEQKDTFLQFISTTLVSHCVDVEYLSI
jgi:hypothetical protein